MCKIETALLVKENIEIDWFEHVLYLRDDPGGCSGQFCENVLSHVVGRDVWKRRSHSHLISEIATISDEAFALFIVENSFQVWCASVDEKGENVAPKYSMRGPGTKKFQGWNKEGITRFNELYDKVETDRMVAETDWERKFMENKFDVLMGRKKKPKRKAIEVNELPVVRARIEAPRADLDSVRIHKARGH